LLISANLLKFSRPCKDCGVIFNSIIHAFAECRSVDILVRFIKLNVRAWMHLTLESTAKPLFYLAFQVKGFREDKSYKQRST
ncbi:Uncharacterized protein FKW44_009809, partial [Caligus rogercresseyi]